MDLTNEINFGIKQSQGPIERPQDSVPKFIGIQPSLNRFEKAGLTKITNLALDVH